MTPQHDATVVHRHIVVDAPIERAFAVFTERFGDFKPREHNMLAVPITATGAACVKSDSVMKRPSCTKCVLATE